MNTIRTVTKEKNKIKKRIAITCTFLLLCGLLYPATKKESNTSDAYLVDEFGKQVGKIDTNRLFNEMPIQEAEIVINPIALRNQCAEVLSYIKKHEHSGFPAIKSGVFDKMGFTLEDFKKTLQFIIDVIDTDVRAKTLTRLYDPHFINNHFRIFRWSPFSKETNQYRPEGEKIRITKYAVFTIKGSAQKNSVYNCALYGLPEDEKGMSIQEAEKFKGQLNRFKYTKQQVLAGAYAGGGAEPLVWVTRSGLEEALMEGTICVELTDGKKKVFNVDRNNGISYNPSIKNPRNQKRYWYFGPVPQPQGYGPDVQNQVGLFGEAALAGDVYNLGLGKLLAIRFRHPQNRRLTILMGILADTGGAFTPNLKQLDYYTGIVNTRNVFKQRISTLPRKAEVYILILKDKNNSPLNKN